MGARGPAPGDPSKLRGHRKVEPFTELRKPKGRARALPSANKYTAQTRAWWKALAESPMSTQFLESDWQQAIRLAELVDEFWLETDSTERRQLEAHIQRGETKLGLTVTDRARLRLKVVAEDEKAEDVKQKRAARRASSSDPRLRAIEGGRGA